MLAVLPAGSLLFAGGAVLLGEGARWLKTATWPGLTVHDGLNWLAGYVPKAEFMTPYLGLNKIISAVLGSPLPFGLAAMGIAWFTLAFFLFSLIPIDDKFKHKR